MGDKMRVSPTARPEACPVVCGAGGGVPLGHDCSRHSRWSRLPGTASSVLPETLPPYRRSSAPGIPWQAMDKARKQGDTIREHLRAALALYLA